MRFFLFLFLFTALAVGCKKKVTSTEQAKIDNEIILQYIAENNLTATPTGSGLYYVINDPGNGASCTSNSSVKVAYKGYFTNGSVFDESAASGITFSLKQVIAGWTEGIPYFKEGGNGILLVPSALGYGPDGTNGIPENSVLIFDVELIDVL